MNEIYTNGRRSLRMGTSPDIKEMDLTPTEKLPLLAKSVRDAKLNRLTILLRPAKACEGLLCLAMAMQTLLENSKVLTIERSLLSHDSINAIRLTKNDIISLFVLLHVLFQSYFCPTLYIFSVLLSCSYFPYTSTYSSKPHNTNRKHNIHHIPYTNIQHSKAKKTHIFNNGRYTTNIPTDATQSLQQT